MSDKKLPLLVYISYRCTEQDTRKQLQQAFGAYNNADKPYHIELRFSENNVKEGESLVEFMDQLGRARFVVLMLSKSYLTSDWCLHELLETNHHKNTEHRLYGVNIKADGDLNKGYLSAVIEDWKATQQHVGELSQYQQTIKECFNNLCQHQKERLTQLGIAAEAEDQYKSICQRLEQAEKEFIRPLKENLVFSVACDQLPEKFEQKANELLAQEKKKLFLTLRRKIANCIKHTSETQQQFLQQQIDATVEDIADFLLDEQRPCADGLTLMIHWAQHGSKTIYKLTDWHNFFKQIETISGWLILKSVDPNWWLHNSLLLTSTASDKGYMPMGLDQAAYVNVVISRSLPESAKFGLDEWGDILPDEYRNRWSNYEERVGSDRSTPVNAGYIFDANANAQAEELLTVIYYDLAGLPEKMIKGAATLLGKIVDSVKARKQIIYYIVTQNYLDRLATVRIDNNDMPLLELLNSRLQDEKRGKLVFVCYECDKADTSHVACREEKAVIGAMAAILRVNSAYIETKDKQ